MLAIRLLSLGLLVLGLAAAPAAEAANQLYQGSWVAQSFGNDITTGGTAAESAVWSVFGMPQGVLCNPGQPRCPYTSTPVTTAGGVFGALGPACTPVANLGGGVRPAKGATATSGGNPLPNTPRYRNPAFFTTAGAPNITSCSATTTVSGGVASFPLTTNDPLMGPVMKGAPVSGLGIASMSPVAKAGAISFPAAPATPAIPCTAGKTAGNCGGMHRTTFGEFNNIFPYVYSYTYATLRNDAGFFASQNGPGSFSVPYKKAAKSIVKAGPNKFGGTMKLLGQLTTKVCYYRNGGCSLGGMNWRYQDIGTDAFTAGGVVTAAYTVMYSGMYYHTALMQMSTVMLIGSRFPWTTGTATVTAVGRGPHNTVAVRAGYDNRTSGGKGTIQLVSPVISKWLQPAANFETGGIAVLRLEFVPEPGRWMLLLAGLSTLAVAYRARGR